MNSWVLGVLESVHFCYNEQDILKRSEYTCQKYMFLITHLSNTN